MTQSERQILLIQRLLDEEPQYKNIKIPQNEAKQKEMLRALFNVREPYPVTEEFLNIQNACLQEETERKGITDIADLQPIQDNLYLWQGDITTLRCDAIVNAANSKLLGCFYPNHGCIDNAIHTFAGVQLRLACAEIMAKQICDEETGKAKITPAFNLPCKYVLHTVGPIVRGQLNQQDCDLLASCYRSCLELAEQNNIKSIAFCCISTGEFHFPNDEAAQIAVNTVKEYIQKEHSKIKVIFNVFKDADYEIYKRILGTNQ